MQLTPLSNYMIDHTTFAPAEKATLKTCIEHHTPASISSPLSLLMHLVYQVIKAFKACICCFSENSEWDEAIEIVDLEVRRNLRIAARESGISPEKRIGLRVIANDKQTTQKMSVEFLNSCIAFNANEYQNATINDEIRQNLNEILSEAYVISPQESEKEESSKSTPNS